jgi:phosphate transport system permease protein
MAQNISYFRQKGDSYVIASSVGLVFSLTMVFFIVIVILIKGLGFFWPKTLEYLKLEQGKAYLGELWARDTKIERTDEGEKVKTEEIQLKIGNRDIYGLDFTWLQETEIVDRSQPQKAVTFERWEYGNFYGFIRSLQISEEKIYDVSKNLLDRVDEAHQIALKNKERIYKLEEDLNKLTKPLTNVQREISLLEISPDIDTEQGQKKLLELQKEAKGVENEIADEHQALTSKIEKLYLENYSVYVNVETADGQNKELHLSNVVRFYTPNQMNIFQKSWIYAKKLGEFIFAEPRESNTEGGVFPAIFGTVMMVLLMSIAVVPLGVLAAIYLNEYAKQGTIIRVIRLSVNNLAGVPSIVFGVFGLGFFIYTIGGTIDQLLFSSKLPEPTFGTGGIFWASLTLALLTLPVVVVATEEGILAVPKSNKEGALALGSTRWQMIRKIVLPNAMPGILTGVILAISRGAGEVAPLMITGVVKLAPTLPLDGTFPFLHLDRKFMHLGFHIYDVGFQSPNVEAAKPMVYTTALLLILIVVVLNLLAIYMRNRLKKKYKSATF